MDINRKSPGTAKGSVDWFTGDVWLDSVGKTGHVNVLSVHFTPGARTAWHRHPDGQVLHVTEGVGRVQARGGVREEVKAGDTIVSGPGEWHWHGAAPDAFMSHFAVSDGTTEWAEHVTNEEYEG